MDGEFCDTNVLLYTISGDARKARIAEQVLGRRPTISVQVLNEFAHAARRKSMRTWAEITDMLSLIGALTEIEPLTLAIHSRGLVLVERYRFSVYDAMIVAAALEAGCAVLHSEDMQDGLVVEGTLRISNPFA